MKKFVLIAFTCLLAGLNGFAQNADVLKSQKDSSLKAAFSADSLKIEKEFAEMAHWEKLKSIAIFPVFNAGLWSGVLPVKDPTEVPDPKLDYKLMFELTSNNPDSTIKEINNGLVEVARIINLHVAAGVPANKITPVIVVHAGALNAICNNDYYKKRFKVDNPNLGLFAELNKFGARFIACGQAMHMLQIEKDNLMPEVKVSLTAKTAISSYQLKGFVWYDLSDAGK